jgi:hypothetical protein
MVYAVPKLFAYQFVLLESIGEWRLRDVEPAALAWAFFGHSPAYGFMLGLLELLCCALLAFPKTNTMGALLTCAVLSQVVFIDVAFDIRGPLPIAIALFTLALALTLVDWRRIVGAARVLCHPSSTGRGGLLVRVGVLAVLFALPTAQVFAMKARDDYPLRGGWAVRSFVTDDKSLALTGGAKVRQPMLYFEFAGVTVLSLDGRDREGVARFAEGHRHLSWLVDQQDETSTIEANVALDGDRLVLQGQQRGKPVRLELERMARWR